MHYFIEITLEGVEIKINGCVSNNMEHWVTGRKETDKLYYWHTGYVGGIKQATFKEMIARRPEAVIEIAVKGMLPKGPLGRAMFRKLKVYAGAEHQHAAQQPQVLDI